MKEVTDPRILDRLRMQIQSIPLSQDTMSQWRLYKAWDYATNYEYGVPELYNVEIIDTVTRVASGVLDATRGKLYLDAMSLMGLVQQRIDAALHAYNAGHDPRFRGM